MYAETPITAAKESPVNSQCLIGRLTSPGSRAVMAIGSRGESAAVMTQSNDSLQYANLQIRNARVNSGDLKKNAVVIDTMGLFLLYLTHH
jgi:hypothetical protein